MKITQLKELIREIISEELSTMDEESQAAKDAKAQGLTSMGFGRWGKDGKVTHKTDRGRLTAVQSDKDVGLRPGKTAATKDKFYRAMPSRSARGMDTRPAAIKGPDGKLQRAEPKWTPDVNRERNKPQDSLGKNPFRTSDGKPDLKTQFLDKVMDKVYDNEEFHKHYNQDMSIDDLSKMTGLTAKQIKAYDKYADDYERAFSVNVEDPNTVFIHDPEDI